MEDRIQPGSFLFIIENFFRDDLPVRLSGCRADLGAPAVFHQPDERRIAFLIYFVADLVRIVTLPAGNLTERLDRLGFTTAGTARQPYPNALQRIILLNLSNCCDPE